MNIKPIRKLPELKENQEWACEGGCDVVRPKKFENVFSESYANDGSSINRQSEFYYTCQNNHLLEVWSTDTSASVMLPEKFYQEADPKVVQSNSIEESINLLSNDIDSLKDSFIEESVLTNDDAETLELLITRAIQLGELFAIRDAKTQNAPEANTEPKKKNLKIGNPQVDFSLAPDWANFWFKDGPTNKCWWSSAYPKLDLEIYCFVCPSKHKAEEAPVFNFSGDWTKSITSRDSILFAQEQGHDSKNT